MKAHQEPKPLVIVLCYQFNSCQCAMSEIAATYVTVLCNLAKHCNFGKTLDGMLQDRLVCGIANPTVQECLFNESELTFTKVVTIAQVVELAEKRSKTI